MVEQVDKPLTGFSLVSLPELLSQMADTGGAPGIPVLPPPESWTQTVPGMALTCYNVPDLP